MSEAVGSLGERSNRVEKGKNQNPGDLIGLDDWTLVASTVKSTGKDKREIC